MYEKMKNQYEQGFVTKDTLKTWVKINTLKRGRGITKAQYKEITGKRTRHKNRSEMTG